MSMNHGRDVCSWFSVNICNHVKQRKVNFPWVPFCKVVQICKNLLKSIRINVSDHQISSVMSSRSVRACFRMSIWPSSFPM